ncbi:MAG: hypothetical protein JWM11_7383 [Planctomycetaceae bacterium]|nr:hypothetical protein [Planctomycetaceae bacterium]
MSDRWTEFHRRISAWYATGEVERLQLVELYQEATDCHETDLDRSFALYTRGRDEARRLSEPWWELFFESWRLNSLTSHAMNYARALPLAMELMVLFNAPQGQSHDDRNMVLDNVLYTYINIDPFGYRNEIERGITYLNGLIEQGPAGERFVLNHRQMSYLSATVRWGEAYDLALHTLALVDQVTAEHTRNWHGSWTLYQLCRICHTTGRINELSGHAEHLEELSKNQSHLRRAHADAHFWQAVTQRAAGDERLASRAYQKGLRLLKDLARRDTICADPMAAYLEASHDLQAALTIRDRELEEVTKNGMLHRGCQIQVERCRLLKRLDKLTTPDLEAARDRAGKLRTPEHFLQLISRIENEAASG